jgi:pyruvate carboxylase
MPAEAGIIFIGPRRHHAPLGNKVAARNLAIEAGVPVMPATDPLPDDMAEVAKMAEEIGYPVMLKASWGGGGRGMRVIARERTLQREVPTAKKARSEGRLRQGRGLSGKTGRARASRRGQILGDAHGNLVHLFERDCSVQRRHQKVVERAPAPLS